MLPDGNVVNSDDLKEKEMNSLYESLENKFAVSVERLIKKARIVSRSIRRTESDLVTAYNERPEETETVSKSLSELRQIEVMRIVNINIYNGSQPCHGLIRKRKRVQSTTRKSMSTVNLAYRSRSAIKISFVRAKSKSGCRSCSGSSKKRKTVEEGSGDASTNNKKSKATLPTKGSLETELDKLVSSFSGLSLGNRSV